MGYRDKMGHRLAHLAHRDLHDLHRRDSHGNSPVMHVPDDTDNKNNFIHNHPSLRQNVAGKAGAVDVQTVESVVYVTMPQTFEGDAQLSTGGSAPASQNAAAAYESAKAAAGQAHAQSSAPAAAPAEASSSPTLYTAPQPRTRTAVTSQSIHTGPVQHTRESSSAAPLQTGPVANTRTEATSVETEGAAVVGGKPLSATHDADSMIGTKDEGMSGGAKAGLAFGIIAVIALFAGLIFFCWRRKKSQKDEGKEQIIDEKHGSFFDRGLSPTPDQRGSMASTRTASTAPRLSLRPVTQFLPNIMENRKSAGNALNAPAMSEKPRSGWERGPAQNPFDDATVMNEKTARSDSPPSNPFDEGDGSDAAARGNHSQKSSWEGSEPPTPKSAKFGTAAAVPVGPGPKGPNNVHRVQLEFKPSMDDELELVSGQLVRMLHEYDDGWALCIRMDRSQQGVCPRTCLSKLPVKPRPQGPPPNGPQGRPMGPTPPHGAPRPFSPQGPPNGNMVPRPLTPNSARERSQTLGRSSPAPQEAADARQRSQSVADGRPQTPTGASVPSRKPVPGMAM